MPQKALTPIYIPQTDVPTKFNTRYKEFPDFIKATCFNRPVFNPYGVELYKSRNQLKAEETIRKMREEEKQIDDDLISFGWKEKQVREKNEVSRSDSVKRAKDKAFEIAYANDFEYFVTLTLDAKKIDRYSVEDVLSKIKDWLKNMAARHDLVYLVLPERHKDGAIHFHGLVSGQLDMVDSGRKTSRGQTIFNLENWSLGFTTAVRLDSQKGNICGYVTKYITKEQKRVFAKHYFAGGKGLKRDLPTRYENQDFEAFDADDIVSIEAAFTMVKYKTLVKVEDMGE